MIYIKHDISIPYDEWKHALKSKTHSMFCKRILRQIYTSSELLKLCVKEGENVKTPNGVHKRKLIPPKVTDAVVSKYVHI